MHNLMRAALAYSKAHGNFQIILELFAGSGRFSAAARKHGWGTVALDISQGPEGDLTDPLVVEVVCGWLSSGCVAICWLGTPCSSWSRARHDINGHGPRTRQSIYGVPNLSKADQERILLGNLTMRSSAKMINVARRSGTVCVLENPFSSLLFYAPPIARIAPKASRLVVDFCRFGTRWRKRTMLLVWNAGDVSEHSRLCQGRKGICSQSGKHHLILKGLDPSSHMPWTKIAEPYPPRLCHHVVSVLLHAVSQNSLVRRFVLSKV